MKLEEVSQNLSALYAELAQAFSEGQARSGLKCLPDCGRCCLFPEIEATALEMLPLALKLWREGRAETVLDELQTRTTPQCWAYQPLSASGEQGRCDHYQERPVVCRAFAVSGLTDKTGDVRLSVCKHIRADQPEQTKQAEASVESWHPPLLSDWGARLLQIHPDLAQAPRPINQALAQALEQVLFNKLWESR